MTVDVAEKDVQNSETQLKFVTSYYNVYRPAVFYLTQTFVKTSLRSSGLKYEYWGWRERDVQNSGTKSFLLKITMSVCQLLSVEAKLLWRVPYNCSWMMINRLYQYYSILFCLKKVSHGLTKAFSVLPPLTARFRIPRKSR